MPKGSLVIMKKLYFLATLLFAVMPLAIASFASQNNDTLKQANPYLKDWSDIGKFFASDYFYASNSGSTKISADYFNIEILKHNKDTLQLGFSLESHINGGARIRNWGNEGSCGEDDEDKNQMNVAPLTLLKPLSPTRAQILFPDFPQCTLNVERDSSNLRIDIEKQKTNQACVFLNQKCEFDVGKEYYITDKYYKLKAGFDCTKARSATEKSICSNPTLANQDRKNNTLYFGTRKWIEGMELGDFTLPNSEKSIIASTLDLALLTALQQELDTQKGLMIKKLLNLQRSFLRKQESCKGEKECIDRVMDEQFTELGGYPLSQEVYYNEIKEALWKVF